jgi:hypothetical protein
MKTRASERARRLQRIAERLAARARRQPPRNSRHRLAHETAGIDNMAALLASDRSPYTIGVIITIDGVRRFGATRSSRPHRGFLLSVIDVLAVSQSLAPCGNTA